jgi:hypothetical protein
MRFEAVQLSEAVIDKLRAKHGVEPEEVREACFSDQREVRRTRDGLYRVLSRSDAGRYLFIVLARKAAGAWEVVTARPMSESERRQYRRRR